MEVIYSKTEFILHCNFCDCFKLCREENEGVSFPVQQSYPIATDCHTLRMLSIIQAYQARKKEFI